MNFKTLWNDPVWSKVISAGIIYLIALMFEKSRQWLWNNWYFPVICVLIVIVIILLKRNSYREQEIDSITYIKVQELVNRDNLLEYIRTANFSMPFKNYIFGTLDFIEYEYTAKPVEYEFIDKLMQELWEELYKELMQFGDYLSINSWTCNNDNYSEIPPEWIDTFPERYEKVTGDTYRLVTNIVLAYDKFIRTGKKKYGLK